jgi:hypothetical protein
LETRTTLRICTKNLTFRSNLYNFFTTLGIALQLVRDMRAVKKVRFLFWGKKGPLADRL